MHFWGRILLFFILNGFLLKTQANDKVDSLEVLIKTQVHDSIRMNALNELASELASQTHTRALSLYFESLQLAQSLNHTVGIVYNLIGIADIYSIVGEYKQALEYISQALKLSDNNRELLGTCYSRLAIEYFNLEEYELSLKNDKLALEQHLLLNDTLNVAYDYHNIGTYHLGKQQFDSAVYFYKKSDSLLIKQDDILFAYNKSRMGFAFTEEKQYEKALECHFNALDEFIKINQTYDIVLENTFISSIYFMMRNMSKSNQYAQIALAEADKLNNHDLYKRIYNLLFDIHNYQKDYKNALKYTLLEKAYTDSIDKKNRESVVNTLNTKYELDEQQHQLKSSKHANKRLHKQRLLLLISSAFTFALLSSLVIIYFQKRKEHKTNKDLVIELNKVNRSTKNILSIIGHDLRGAVGNLKNFTHLMHHNLLDNKSIGNMIKKFIPMVDSTYDLLDNLLTWSRNENDQFTPHPEELDASEIIDLTINHLNHLAEVKQIELKTNIEDFTIKADRNMLLTVIRNLLSNAIKFSYPNSTIIITTRVNDKLGEFSIIDSGKGLLEDEIQLILDKDKLYHTLGTKGEKGSGLGLVLCHSFILKHNGKLNIESKVDEGSKFSFTIPLNISDI